MSAAPSIVQHVPGSGAGATITLTGTLGNLYVLLAWNFAANAANASDTAGNAWAKIADVADANANRVSIYAAPITNAGATTIADVTGSGGVMDAIEVSGWSGSTADLKTFTLAVPSTAGPFNAAAAQQQVLAPSLFILLAENQAGAATLSAGLSGVAATQVDSIAGLDKSVCWQISQSTVPALVDPYVGSSAADDMGFAGVIIPNADAPAAPVFGGGVSDDRYRFRPSSVVSHTSTQMHLKSAWPTDARDFGRSDTVNDNVSRLN